VYAKIKNNTNIFLQIYGFLSLVFTVYYGKTGLTFTLTAIIVISIVEILLAFRKEFFSPYLLFVFSPIILIHFSSIRDFRIRIFIFIILAYIITIILKTNPISIPVLSNINSTNLKPFKIWFISFLIFFGTSVFLFYKGVYLSGDEPHFLTISQSIVDDWDFELSNNYKEDSYFILKPELKGTGWKIAPHITRNNNTVRSFHMPGVAFLMTPFYALYKVLGYPVHPAIFFRFATAFYNAFFALSIFLLLRIYFKNKNVFWFWLIIITSFPLLFHSTTIFPEIPAALMAINIFIFGFTKYKNFLFAGFFLALLPWFHVKYYPLMLVFMVALAIELFKDWKISKKFGNLIKFLIFPTMSLFLLMLFCKILYGTVNPTQIFPKQNYFLAYFLKVKVFFAYFIDQRDGLLTYAPYLFLLFFGIREKFMHRFFLFSAALFYVMLHAFTTVRGAYAPAGRPLIFVIWIFILLVANFYFNENDNEYGWRKFFFKLTVGFTYFFSAWFFYYPFFMFQPVFSGTKNGSADLFNFLGSDTINLSSFYPSFLAHPVSIQIANIVWISLLIITIIIFYTRLNRHFLSNKIFQLFKNKRKELQRFIAIFIFILFSFGMAFYPHIHLDKRNMFTVNKIPVYKTAKLFHYLKDIKEGDMEGKSFRLKEGYDYDLYFDLTYWKNRKKVLKFAFKGKEPLNFSLLSKTTTLKEILNKRDPIFNIKMSELKRLKIKNKIYGTIAISTDKTKTNSHIYLTISNTNRTRKF